MAQPKFQISWQPVERVSTEHGITRLKGFIEGREVRISAADPILRVLEDVGIPVPTNARTPKECALALLSMASEVEHALMVQYLYAMTSIVGGAGADGVDQRRAMKNIAIQEMGHMVSVQNLLLLLGGVDALYMNRDDLRSQGLNGIPNPLPFILEPVTEHSLARYVIAESPAKIPAELEARMIELRQRAGANVNRVGAIYAVLIWLFMSETEAIGSLDLSELAAIPKGHITDDDLVPADQIAFNTATRNEWGVDDADFILETPTDRGGCLEILRDIAEQGEGLEHSEGSHFSVFVNMAAALDGDDPFQVLPIATSPTTGEFPGGDGPTVIQHVYTGLWGKLFARQYTLLVLALFHGLRVPRNADGSPGLREGLIEAALKVMRRAIMPISDLMATLPLRAGSSDLAGPPYDLDPNMLSIGDEAELAARHLLILDQLDSIYSAISSHPEVRDNDKIVLANLRRWDATHRALFQVNA